MFLIPVTELKTFHIKCSCCHVAMQSPEIGHIIYYLLFNCAHYFVYYHMKKLIITSAAFLYISNTKKIVKHIQCTWFTIKLSATLEI